MQKSRNGVEEHLKKVDIFGHPIDLNFNQNGSRHKTVVGGFFSIFIKGALLFVTIIILRRMFIYDDNKEMQHNYLISMDEDQPDAINNVNYSSMRTKIFLAIRKQPNELIDEKESNLAKYLNILAVQQDIDWYKVNTDEFNIETPFHMHRCVQEDFGNDD